MIKIKTLKTLTFSVSMFDVNLQTLNMNSNPSMSHCIILRFSFTFALLDAYLGELIEIVLEE